MNYRIEKSMQVIRNLPTKAVADQQRSPTKTIAKESYLNRCLAHIERIHKVVAVDLKTKKPALEEAWKIYAFLQKFDPIVGETLHPKAENQSREVSLETLPWVADPENLNEHYADLLAENGIVETSAPDLYAGGLGYRHVNWDAEYLMAVDGSERHHNPYWNPKEAYPKPVKHFTKEELEALNCPSG
jgi:hypothetical protein